MLEGLQRELTSTLAENDLTTYSRARAQALLRQTNAIITRYYIQINDTTTAFLSQLAPIQSQLIVAVIDTTFAGAVQTALPTSAVLKQLASDTLIEGAPSASWWGRQAGDTTFRFTNAVRQGMVAAETNQAIVRRVRDVMDLSRRNAEALVRTSVQSVANNATRETFKANGDIIEGIKQLSTLDNRTTPICIAYAQDGADNLGAEYDLEFKKLPGTRLPYNNGTPRHWGCRSREIPLLKTFKQLGVDLPEFKPTERSAVGGPVSSGTTFAQWLARRTTQQQDEQLGKGRAQLWRDGKITLNQLLDLRGNTMTLEQLQGKYL